MNNTAIVERTEVPAPAPYTPDPELHSMMAMIERASSDKGVDIDKFERMMAMMRQLKADHAKQVYFRQMRLMKPDLPVIDRRGRIEIHEKGKPKTAENLIQSTGYGRWEDIDKAISPILSKYGFVMTYSTGSSADGKVEVTTICTHDLGHQESTTITLAMDTSGSKNNVQAVGSSLSYGKRYGTTFLLNIRTKGEDDDGKSSDDGKRISIEVVNELSGMCNQAERPVDAFVKWMASKFPDANIEALADITVGKQLNMAREALNYRINERQREKGKKK